MEPIVNVPIGDYDAMRERVKDLEAENARLRECCEHLCEENKVMVIRKDYNRSTISDMHMCYIPVEQTELKNFDEVKDEVVQELAKKVERLEEANKSLGETADSMGETNKALCKKAQELEKEVERLKNRNWWKRLWNK